MATLKDRITVDPKQCKGRPCIRDTQIRVADVLDLLAQDLSREQILTEHPGLESKDICAFVGVIWAIMKQQEELELHRDDLQNTQEEMKEQKGVMQQEVFERSFFQLQQLLIHTPPPATSPRTSSPHPPHSPQ